MRCVGGGVVFCGSVCVCGVGWCIRWTDRERQPLLWVDVYPSSLRPRRPVQSQRRTQDVLVSFSRYMQHAVS